MDKHYIAILVPEGASGWTVLFPDLPGCVTHGETVEEAQWMATEAADLHLETMRFEGREIPPARDLQAIRGDDAWMREHQIDWSSVVVSMLRPHGHTGTRSARAG
jgi:predicted RNase H-like HicB family nuclease